MIHLIYYCYQILIFLRIIVRFNIKLLDQLLIRNFPLILKIKILNQIRYYQINKLRYISINPRFYKYLLITGINSKFLINLKGNLLNQNHHILLNFL
jgi:hypothetical protein